MTDEEGRPHKFREIDGVEVAGIYDEEFKDWTGRIGITGYDVELILNQEECRYLGAQLMSIGRRSGPRLPRPNKSRVPTPEELVVDEATLENILFGRPFTIGYMLKGPYIETLYHDHGWSVSRINAALKTSGDTVNKVLEAGPRPYQPKRKKS